MFTLIFVKSSERGLEPEITDGLDKKKSPILYGTFLSGINWIRPWRERGLAISPFVCDKSLHSGVK
jgi:hypothetical protein